MKDKITQEMATECFNQQDINKLLKLIASGKAILFAGAGFSSEAISIMNGELPIARVLADKIDEITDETSNQDLFIASQNAIDNNMEDELIDLIKDLFTVKKILSYHNTILSIPWRRYYTTNYDSVIKDAGLQNDKRIKCITTADSVTENLKEKELCIHINGNLENLNKDTLNSSFKLSESSYLHHDALNDTPWVDVFERDIAHASAIVFIGYSMYDYNIKSLLFNNEESKDKIYFITREKPCDKVKTEKKYGKVINIGVKSFADYIADNKNVIDDYSHNSSIIYESLMKYDILDSLTDISHDMIRDFLIYGKYDKNYIEYAIRNRNKNKHLIIPAWIDECLDLIKDSTNTHIAGDLGTGKSVGIKILAAILALNGENVFYLNDKYGDYIGDIVNIIKHHKGKIHIFVDNAEQNYEIIKHIYSVNNPRIHCISASRKNINFLFDEKLHTKTKIFSLDKLRDIDIQQLVTIIENIGMAASFSNNGLKSFIEDKCTSSLPSFLLTFLKSEEIALSIKKNFQKLDNLHNNKYRSTMIAANLLGVLNRDLSFSVISTLTNNSNIRNSELLNHPIFQNFFITNNGKVESKSPIFATYILQNYYIDSIKKDAFVKFAIISNQNKRFKNLNEKELNIEYEGIFKELMKYVSLSKLFTEDNFDIILGYFEKLKSEIDWLESDPNHWLQLALLNMARGNLVAANDEISTARKKAIIKTNYQFDYIDTVEARYKLNLALTSRCNIQDCYDLFFEADNLLSNTEGSDQKYRQINRYIDIFKKINHSISKKDLETFLQRINFQISRIKELEDENYIGIERLYLVYNCEANLNKIISITTK